MWHGPLIAAESKASDRSCFADDRPDIDSIDLLSAANLRTPSSGIPSRAWSPSTPSSRRETPTLLQYCRTIVLRVVICQWTITPNPRMMQYSTVLLAGVSLIEALPLTQKPIANIQTQYHLLL